MALIPEVERQNQEVLCEVKAKLSLHSKFQAGHSNTLGSQKISKRNKELFSGGGILGVEPRNVSGLLGNRVINNPTSPFSFYFKAGLTHLCIIWSWVYNPPVSGSRVTGWLSQQGFFRYQISYQTLVKTTDIVSNIVETLINYVLTVYENESISSNINTNTLWELKPNPFWTSVPLLCNVLASGWVPKRAWNWSNLNRTF